MLLYTLDVHAESATPYVRALPASPDSARGRALDAAINEQSSRCDWLPAGE